MKTINKAIVADVTQRYVNNLLALWGLSAKASNWYALANAELQVIADVFGVDMECVTYVVATLSPALSWQKNLESAYAFFAGWFGNHNYAHCKQTAYGSNVRKCTEYMFGVRTGTPTGQKVSAFYQNLLGNYNVVTLDRHAIRAARMGVRNMKAESGAQDICKQEFTVVQKAYMYAAECVGVSVAEFQAVLWALFCQ